MKFLIVYRDNDLFAKYVPKIVEWLMGAGCVTEVKMFPMGTPETEMAAMVVPEECKLLPDQTFQRAKEDVGERSHAYGESLDSLLKAATSRAFRPKGTGETVGETARTCFGQIVAEVLESGVQPPEEVLIARRNLLDHVSREVWDSSSEEGVAQEIAGWFRGIFPDVTIRISDDSYPTPKRGWLVADRHYKKRYASVEECRGAEVHLMLRLPLETAVYDLAEDGILKISDEEFETSLKEELLWYYDLNKDETG